MILCSLAAALQTASAQGTAFTYQGQLAASGQPATGLYDFEFALFNAANGTGQIGTGITNHNVPVSNGLFTVTLDFGSGAFTGQSTWLQVGVETNGGPSFTILYPLQPVTPAPAAIYAATAGNALNASGNGGNLTNLQASQIVGFIYATSASNSLIAVLASNLVPGAPIANAQLTTPTLFNGNNGGAQYVVITNGAGIGLTGAQTNALVINFVSATRTTNPWITYNGPGGQFIEIQLWPDHGGFNDPELAVASSGSVAFVTGVGGGIGAPYQPGRGFQIGNPDYRDYFYLNIDHFPTGLGSDYLGWSTVQMFRSAGYLNGSPNVIQPAWQVITTDTNGSASLALFDNIDTTVPGPSYTNWSHLIPNFPNPPMRARYRVTMSGSQTNVGFDVWGTENVYGSATITNSLAVGPLNGVGGSVITNCGIAWLSTNLAPGITPDAGLPNGSICTTTNGAFYVRSNGLWVLH